MVDRKQAMKDFVRHSRCVNFYTNKQVWVAQQGRHYHISGCAMDDSDGPHEEEMYHKDLSNESGERYIPCSCAFDHYQEDLHSALVVQHGERD
jgi:hypothetical protein